MQIGQLNHLNYPTAGNQTSTGSATGESGTTAGASAQSSGRSTAAAPAATVQDAVGVILKLQADISPQPSVALQKDLVYSDGRQRNVNDWVGYPFQLIGWKQVPQYEAQS